MLVRRSAKRKALLASLHGRIEAYLDRGDASAVLADEALTEVAELPRTGREVTLEMTVVAARLYWCRFLALPDGHGDDDHELAVGFFDLVREIEPTLAPARLDAAATRAELATSMLARDHNDDPAAQDHAVDLLRRAVRAVPADHPDRTDWLADLSIALRSRFDRREDLADLDAAVAAAREAVETVPAEHPNRAACLSILGNALQVRFERLDDAADLEAAVAAQREAVASAPAGSSHLARFQSNLCVALQTRFGRSGDVADLDAAIAAGREAVESTPVDHPRRQAYVGNLDAALQTQSEKDGV